MSIPKLHIQNATNASCPDLRGQGYKVSFDTHSFARGPRKKIYHGHLGGAGPRKGEHAVVKVFRDKPGTEDLTDQEIEKHRLARKLAARFNKLVADERSQIRFTLPLKSTVDSLGLGAYFHRHTVRAIGRKEWVLMEENLLDQGNYQVFINRRGERLNQEPTSLDAFMHFTYHESEGLFLMCGFQGIHNASGYKLTTPCIHSTDHSFGHTVDKGRHGIKMVFKQHHCNNLCYGFRRPDFSEMDDVSSSSEKELLEEEEEEEEKTPKTRSHSHNLEHKQNGTEKDEKKFNRTKKMAADFDIPKDELPTSQLPKVSSDPDTSCRFQFKKSPSPMESNHGKEEKKKKKKKSHRSNVKVLTTILKKVPSF